MKPAGLDMLEKRHTTPDWAFGFTPGRTCRFDIDDPQQSPSEWEDVIDNLPPRFIRLVAFSATLNALVIYASAGESQPDQHEPLLHHWGLNQSHTASPSLGFRVSGNRLQVTHTDCL